MRKLPAAFSTLALATVATVGTPTPALAATGDFGNACVETTVPSNTTLLIVANGAGSPLPATAPSSGVITQARVTLPSGGFAFPTKLKVARSTGVASQYTVQAESPVFTVGGGAQSYPVRVPVTTGDLIGLGGVTSFGCTSTGDTAAIIAGDAAVGAPMTYTPQPNVSVPLVATVEPDADHDGYGDATQDLCPQSAALQTACPSVDSFAVSTGNKITVLVTASGVTDVRVTGLAKANGKKIKLKGGTKTVKPGVITVFKVRVPKALKGALSALPAGKSIKVKMTATSTIAGPHATHTSSVRLHGTRH
jgi:hypothetical protein